MPTIGDLKVFPSVVKDPTRVAERNLETRLDNLSIEEQQRVERMSGEEQKKISQK
jgi:hypothetical protein